MNQPLNPFETLTGDAIDPAEAEVKLDLRGQGALEALSLLDRTVKNCGKMQSRTLYIRYDKADGSGETLFQPVAKYLRDRKAEKIVAYSRPIMQNDEAGFLVVFTL